MGNGIRSVREAAAILDELGIASISERMILEFERSWNSVPQEIRDSLDVVTMLLAAVGVGTYDTGTCEWTPTSDRVYSFDVEVSDIDRMYREYSPSMRTNLRSHKSGRKPAGSSIRQAEKPGGCGFCVTEESVFIGRR